MRLLLIHAEEFSFEARQKAIPSAEEVSPERKSGSARNALVVFCTVEKADDKNPDAVVEAATSEVIEVFNKVRASEVVVYPYAHLSKDLAPPTLAVEVLKKLEQALMDKGLKVFRTPFGWYKAFTVKCLGHPLAELSRTILPEEAKPAEKPEEVEAAKSTFVVLTPEGEEYPLDMKNPLSCQVLERDPALKQLVLNEAGLKEERAAPPHIKLMKRLELVDYEPASDIGHFRFYPKGAVLKEALEEFATQIAVRDLRAMKIETPFLYRLDEPDIAEQAARFRERDYRLEVDDREFTLRFAGDFGLFKMMKDVTMSYKQLPIRVYELAPSFRLEQRGECVGLKRLRSFTMPDLHCFCKDLGQAMNEYRELFKQYTRLANSMEIDYAVAFRVVKDFYLENKEWFVELLKIVGKPALIELLPEMKHYWVAKHEYQAIDSTGGNMQLVTVQLDIEDAARYGINYVDEDGSKRGCIILHSSMGSIERWIAAILEQAAKNIASGKPPKLPLWLSPIQVRVIPVSKAFLEYAESLAKILEAKGFRVDVDDREETVPKKIRDAEVEWIPFIVVVGEKEVSTGVLSVRERGVGTYQVQLEELIMKLNNAIGDKPRVPSYLPLRLSMRPRFAA